MIFPFLFNMITPKPNRSDEDQKKEEFFLQIMDRKSLVDTSDVTPVSKIAETTFEELVDIGREVFEHDNYTTLQDAMLTKNDEERKQFYQHILNRKKLVVVSDQMLVPEIDKLTQERTIKFKNMIFDDSMRDFTNSIYVTENTADTFLGFVRHLFQCWSVFFKTQHILKPHDRQELFGITNNDL